MAGLLAGASIAAAAFPSQAELPPAAQAPFDKAMVAARQQAWDIAIQNLQEARQAAPAAPEILYNLGLAESKLPGRELRAIAWFGAYLAAEPKAGNATAVRDFIASLQVKNETDTQRLIRTVQAAALQIPYENDGNFTYRRDEALAQVAGLWASVGNEEAAVAAAALISPKDYMGEHASAKTGIADGETARVKRTAEGGDFAGALSAAAAISDQGETSRAREAVADAKYDYVKAQILAGDVAGAKSTADAIGQALNKSYAESVVAVAQAQAGDIAAAQASLAATAQAAEQGSPSDQSYARDSVADARLAIVAAQLAAGDIAGAQRTAEPLVDSGFDHKKSQAKYDICLAQIDAGDVAGGRRTAELIGDAQLKIYALGKVAEAQAAKADVSGAQATLLAATRTADLPENSSLKTYAEETIAHAGNALAEAQLKAGDTAGARASIGLAAQAAESIPAGYQRDSSLSDIAGVQAKSGDFTAAQKTVEGIAGPGDRRFAEVAIAQAQAKAGDLAGARASLALAAAAAELESSASSKVGATVAVAEEQAKIGDLAGARATILLAEQAAQSIGDSQSRASAEAAIAEAHAKTGDAAAARSAILSAQANAALITDAQWRVLVQASVAVTQAEIGDLDGARSSILIAQKAATALRDGSAGPLIEGMADRRIAFAQVKAGDLAGASISAARIADRGIRAAALSDIAKAQGKDGAAVATTRITDSSPRYPPRRPLVTVAAWTAELGALDKPLFLDPTAYLQTLPSDTPQKGFDALMRTARTVVDAQGTVDVMLARQAR